MDTQRVDMSVKLPRREAFAVVRCRIQEGLSMRTRATVEVATDTAVPFGDSLGEPAAIEIGGSSPRVFGLRLIRAHFLGDHGGSHHYELELVDEMGLLDHRTNTRKFRDTPADQIATRVLGDAGIHHVFRLSAPLPSRPYCVQYRETDLAFVERLMEAEGVHYVIGEDGTPTFGDASPTASSVRGEAFELLEAGGAMSRGEEGIHAFRRGARSTTGAVTCTDTNWKNPKLGLVSTAYGDHDTHLEHLERPAGFRLPEEGQRLAKLRVEAHRVRAHFVEGRGSVVAFAPGRAFTFGSSAGDAFAGRYLITQVEHVYHAGEFHEGGAKKDDERHATYENHFEGMPLAAPFRPKLKTPRPRVGGTHTAMVRGPAGEEIHTDQHGRFRAQFHWDREATGTDADSRWIRMLQETSTSQTLARTGWEVFVAYIDGDPDRPVGVGRAINGIMPPTYAQPAQRNVMSVKTPSSPSTGGYNELKMDDSAGSQSISMRAERNLDALVKNDKSEVIGNDETHAVGTDLTRQVQGDQSTTIGGNSSLTVGGNQKVVIEGSRTVKVGGSEKNHAGTGITAAIGGSDTEKVGSLRLTKAGSFKMPSFADLAKTAAQSFLSSASPGAAQALATVQKLRGSASAGALSNAGSAVLGSAVTALAKGQGFDGAATAAEGSLTSLLPNQKSLGNLTSPQGWVPSAAGLENAAKGVVAQVVNVDNVVNMLFAGGIERNASVSMFKLVGGAYVTVALLGIDVKVGLAYLETIGGAKLTLSGNAITESVDGMLILTVGGTILRTSTAVVSMTTKTTTSVGVGIAASYTSKQKLLITGKTVKITAKNSLVLKNGAVEIALDPGAVQFKGKMNLSADGDVVLTGGAKLDLT